MSSHSGAAARMAMVSLLLLVAGPMQASSSGITISQYYPGGGEIYSAYTHDYIELCNTSSQPVCIDGWSIQVGPFANGTWYVGNLGGTIGAHHYFLIREAGGIDGGTLPAPDLIGSGWQLSISNRAVALVSSRTPLSGASPSGLSVVDLLGFGTCTAYEGAPAGNLNNFGSLMRCGDGATDTGNNLADFFYAYPPLARNSSSRRLAGLEHPGDADDNGMVDVGDLGIVAVNWGRTSRTWKHGDFNGDNVVDVADLGVLAFNWAWVSDSPVGQGAASVPEPASLILLLAGSLIATRRRR